MKKILLFVLICISASLALAQFRRAIFLHHSVGNCLWDRSRVSNLTPPTTLPKEVAAYNSKRGYTGSSAVSMDEVYFPDPPDLNDNNWYRWDNIFNGRDAQGITMDSYYSSYPVIVVKTCYLATQFMSVIDSIQAYKAEWRHILTVMKNHPNNFFCLWTTYPAATDGHADRDAWSNLFCIWAKDTLAAGKDSFGPLPPNVYVFDVFHKLASRLDGYCDPVYGSFSEGPGGDHPSNLAVSLIDSAFVREMFDAAIAYEHPLTPVAATLPASNISTSGAQINGSVNPNGTQTSYHFEYGLTSSYGTSTSTQSAGAVSGTVAVSATISGLSAGTVYHYRIAATYGGGTAFGNDASFTTSSNATPPTATTSAATAITPTGAQLNGSVNPNGSATRYHFDFGTTTAYGDTTAGQIVAAGSGNTAVQNTLTGLSPSTLYHFRLVAVNGGGTSNGADLTFTTTTATAPPAVRTTGANGITTTGAQIDGTVNPNGLSTTYHFEYGLTKSYGTSTTTQNGGSGTSSIAVSAFLSGLSPATLYHFRLVASNSSGSTNGNDTTLTTGNPVIPLPTVRTSPPTVTTNAGMMLNGTVNPNGSATTAYFEYGISSAYGLTTAVQNLGAGQAPVSVSATVSGLAPGTMYHYRIAAQNSGGTAYGVDTTFVTALVLPKDFVLLQNYPNPFNPSTTIRYGLPHRVFVTLEVFNTLGQPISTLVSGEQAAGFHEAVFDGSNLSSGTYFYRLTAGDDLEVRRIVLVH